MSPAGFQWCAGHVLGVEGGEVDHPRDPGGHTKYGVTQTTLDRAHALIAGLPANVGDLTGAHALQVYEALYWRPVRGDELPLPLALLTFDAAVNQGPERAAQFLQAAVGASVDGRVGDRTVQAAQRADLRKAIDELAARRMHAYMLLDALDDTFGLGWSRRLISLLRVANDAMGATR
jgi:lysozyme family protein